MSQGLYRIEHKTVYKENGEYIFTKIEAGRILKYFMSGVFLDEELKELYVEVIDNEKYVVPITLHLPLILLALYLKEYDEVKSIIERGLFLQKYLYGDVYAKLDGKTIGYISLGGMVIADPDVPEDLIHLIWEKIVSKKRSKKRIFCHIFRDYISNFLLNRDLQAGIHSKRGLEGIVRVNSVCPRLLDDMLYRTEEYYGYIRMYKLVGDDAAKYVKSFITVMYDVLANNAENKKKLLHVMFNIRVPLMQADMLLEDCTKNNIVSLTEELMTLFLNYAQLYKDTEDLRLYYIMCSIDFCDLYINLYSKIYGESYKKSTNNTVINFVNEIKTQMGDEIDLNEFCKYVAYKKSRYDIGNIIGKLKRYYHYEMVFDLSYYETSEIFYELARFETEELVNVIFMVDAFIRDEVLESVNGIEYNVEFVIEELLRYGNADCIMLAMQKGLILDRDLELCWNIVNMENFKPSSKSKVLPVILSRRIATNK